jgi:arylsulfatase A-like enzyme
MMGAMPFGATALLRLVAAASLAQAAPPQGSTPAAAASVRRNLLIVTFDTTRRDFVGFLGRTPSPTPNLDALAQKSVVFTDAFTVAPLTLPAHSSLLTGLYPVSHGVHENSAFKLPAGAATLAKILKEQGYATGAAVAADVLDPVFGIAQGFDRYNSPRGVAGGSLLPERRADEQVDQALADLAALRGNPPFFYWLHFFDPHYPYAAPVHFPATPEELSERDGAVRHSYVEEIHFADRELGRLLAWLEQQNLLDELVVVFAADHGESLGDTPESSHGFFLFDPTVRIPMFVRAPGLSPRQIATQVSLIDVVPTVLDLLAVDASARRFDGVDLAPLMKDGSVEPPDRALLLESWFAWLNYGWAPFDGCVQASFKYLRSARRELFDRSSDPRETRNLFDPAAPSSRFFVRRLEALRASAAARLESDPLELDAEERARLEKLGYAVATTRDDAPFDGAGGASPLPDAYTKAPLLKRLEEVTAAQANGRLDAAADLLRALVKQEPKSASLDEQLGLVLVDLAGRAAATRDPSALLDEAEERLRSALELDGRRAHAHFGLALCAVQRCERLRAAQRAARERGDLEGAKRLAPEERAQARRALRSFRDALVFDPGLSDCMMDLARFLESEAARALRASDLAEALADEREIVALIDRLLARLPADAKNRKELADHRAQAQARIVELERGGKSEKSERKDGAR